MRAPSLKGEDIVRKIPSEDHVLRRADARPLVVSAEIGENDLRMAADRPPDRRGCRRGNLRGVKNVAGEENDRHALAAGIVNHIQKRSEKLRPALRGQLLREICPHGGIQMNIGTVKNFQDTRLFFGVPESCTPSAHA